MNMWIAPHDQPESGVDPLLPTTPIDGGKYKIERLPQARTHTLQWKEKETNERDKRRTRDERDEREKRKRLFISERMEIRKE